MISQLLAALLLAANPVTPAKPAPATPANAAPVAPTAPAPLAPTAPAPLAPATAARAASAEATPVAHVETAPACGAPVPSTTQAGYLVADPDCDLDGTPFTAELTTAFDDLTAWIRTGRRPGGNAILDPRAVASPAFGCRWTRGVRPAFVAPPCPS